MNDYPKSHPLCNRSESWIAQRAADAVHTANKVPHGAYDVLIRADAFAAVVHMAKTSGERADRAEARALAASSIITDLQLHMDPNAIGDLATEAFERAMEWLTEAPV